MGEAFEIAAELVKDDEAAGWPVDRLIDHIVTTHHAYTRGALLGVAHHLKTLADLDGARHPELARIASVWDRLGVNLMHHMMKEERVLFPYIRDLAAAQGRWLASPFGSVENPIRMMEREHQDADEELRAIRELSDGYTAPADGCATYRLCFEELAHFERDLHRHVHLENNVLFPKAVTLERRS